MTGTFDDWKKTEKLEKVGGHFEKAVALKDASAKIYYKVRRISSRPTLVIFNCLIYPCFFFPSFIFLTWVSFPRRSEEHKVVL